MKKRVLVLSIFLCICLAGAASCSSYTKSSTAGTSSHNATVTTKAEATKVSETTAAPTPTPQPTATPTPKPTPTPTPTLTPDQKEDTYLAVEYKEYARNPDKHEYELVKLNGKVIQVLEEKQDDGGTFLTLRVVQNDDYDTIWLVAYDLPDGASRILEGDKVKIYGASAGVYTYDTVQGGSLTVPLIVAEDVIVKS